MSTCHSPISITFELILQSQSYTIDARLTDILNLPELQSIQGPSVNKTSLNVLHLTLIIYFPFFFFNKIRVFYDVFVVVVDTLKIKYK